MHKMKNFLLCVFCLLGGMFMMKAYAQDHDVNTQALMTPNDVKNNSLSNVTITNRTGQTVPVSGLYISSFDINECSACYGGVVSGDNLGGAVISPLVFRASQMLPIGQNYLYNMLYNGIYYIRQTAGSSPCALPGCSWPGDDPNVHGWCISINVVSRNSNYTYSHYTNGAHPASSTPPYGAAGNSTPFDYKYALINPNTLGTGNACIGPITCNDKTLACKVSTAQNESFQSY